MRTACQDMIYEVAKHDPRVVYIGSDMLGGPLDRMKEEFPDRYFMEGISEATVIGMAAGLALKGYIPFVFAVVIREHDADVLVLPGSKLAVGVSGSQRAECPRSEIAGSAQIVRIEPNCPRRQLAADLVPHDERPYKALRTIVDRNAVEAIEIPVAADTGASLRVFVAVGVR